MTTHSHGKADPSDRDSEAYFTGGAWEAPRRAREHPPAGAPPPKRRGRPPGAKNKPKPSDPEPKTKADAEEDAELVPVESPDRELCDATALVPLALVSSVLEYLSRPARGARGVVVVPPQESIRSVQRAYYLWVCSVAKKIKLTPFKAMLGAYTSAIGAMVAIVIGQAKVRADELRERHARANGGPDRRDPPTPPTPPTHDAAGGHA